MNSLLLFEYGTVGSNPTQVMDACVYVAALRRTDHWSKESYRLYKEDYGIGEEARAQ
jgi:hypothetical protein